MRNQVDTLSEMLEAHKKWWDERVQATRELQGWSGRDLRDQNTLLNVVAGMEDDITFLLRYVRQLTEQLERVTTTASTDSNTTFEVEKNVTNGDERSSDD